MLFCNISKTFICCNRQQPSHVDGILMMTPVFDGCKQWRFIFFRCNCYIKCLSFQTKYFLYLQTEQWSWFLDQKTTPRDDNHLTSHKIWHPSEHLVGILLTTFHRYLSMEIRCQNKTAVCGIQSFVCQWDVTILLLSNLGLITVPPLPLMSITCQKHLIIKTIFKNVFSHSPSDNGISHILIITIIPLVIV